MTRLHAFASAGDLAAALQLGRMYALGRGVQPSPRDAETWLSRAAQGDAPGAAFALAALLEREARDEAAFAAAAQWYEHAAAAGEARAQYNLARLYRLGHGVPRDPERARALYEAAAEQGSIRAQLTLAMLFEGGESWPRDEAAALARYGARRWRAVPKPRSISRCGMRKAVA